MSNSKDRILSKAFGGGPLVGDTAVRFIYIDEAGTSAQEPVSVVVGIVVDADNQWKRAESLIIQALELVPECFRKDFIFHAKAVWGDKKYRDQWSLNDRLETLHRMMKIPRILRMPIALGVVRRDAPPFAKAASLGLSQEAFQHVMAFWMCITKADKYIREFACDEVATIVAEDVPRIRTFLRSVLNLRQIPIPDHWITLTQAEISTGMRTQDSEARISRVIDTVHFLEKRYGPLLQIADACAFGFRRYFAGQKLGEDFVRSIIGSTLAPEDRSGPSSASLFSPHNPK
jgi:hypothetical protein